MANQTEGPDGPDDSNATKAELPAIVAAFLVKFDERKGYTLAWQKSIDTLDIEGVVEFKSMPSGLHNVRTDLVYFVYEEYAGISAVLNVYDADSARKAKVIAAGVLVPLEHGRMGKSWLHAENLQVLAEQQISNADDFSMLEQYWEDYKVSTSPQLEDSNSPTKEHLSIDTNVQSSTNGYRMNRSMSVGIGNMGPVHILPAHHPALVLPEFLRLFGPLVFPLVRAALLRKRILMLGEAPVEKTCNYVYNLSILSSIPKPIVRLLPNLDPSHIKQRPLFNIGVSDIPFLEAESKSSGGWIACTTDDVVCTKPDLFDVLVLLPSATAQKASMRPYPRIYYSSSELSKARPKYGLRASARDAKRFANISEGLQSIPRARRKSMQVLSDTAIASSSEDSPEITPRPADPIDTASVASVASSTISLKDVVEPQSWSRIAYTSLVWWASAGDNRGGLTALEETENEQDVALLTGENLDEEDEVEQDGMTREVACVQYFHRLNNMMFTALGDAIKRGGGQEPKYRDQENDEQTNDTSQNHDENEDSQALLPKQSRGQGDSEVKVEVTQEDMQSMGLDVWSQADRQFVEDLAQFWWGRKADVQGGRVECCGMRIL